MSAVPADVLVKREFINDALDPRRTESKFSLAMDAVTRGKSHAGESVTAYLEVLLDVLENLPVVQTREGAFDVRILAAIDVSKEFVNQYRNLVVVISESDHKDDFASPLIMFLEGVLKLKKQYPLDDRAAYLWRDAPGFMCRELFLSTQAALLANGAWRSVRRLLDHRYAIPDGEVSFGFNAFDGFQRSLDVFRNRRLDLQRVSVTADVLKERVRESALSFEQIMQADFVLHLFCLLKGAEPMQGWHARTLGFAHEQQLTGFDVFVDARAGKPGQGMSVLFDVPDWTRLYATLEPVMTGDGANLDGSLDYAGFVAANNAIFNH